jgi:hypothetical protein
MGYTTKGVQMVHGWLALVPSLIRRLVDDTFHRTAVENVDHHSDGLALEDSQQALCLEHNPRRANHHLVAPFNNTILLWGVWCHQLSPQTMLHTMLDKLRRRELAAPI